MKKQGRRFIALLLSCVMCLSALQGMAWAEEDVLIEDILSEEELFQENGDVIAEIGQEEPSEPEEVLQVSADAQEEAQSEEKIAEDAVEDTADIIAQDADGIIYEEISQPAYVPGGDDDSCQSVTEVYINPLYSDILTEEDLADPNPYGIAFLSDYEEYGTIQEAAVSFRSQMKQRLETITVKVHAENTDSAAGDVSAAAMVHTGNPVEGDYLKWQYAGWKCVKAYYPSAPDNLTLTYTMTYYTTAEQENELDSAIEAAKSSLGLTDGSKTTYEKIKTIYDYISQNVTYDYDNLNNDEYKLKYTAYAAMMNKTAVCQGYALLFYRLALECGIDARLIAGTGNGGAHGWNIVKIGNCYYNLDATWDASYYKTNQKYNYFLRSSDNFGSHVRYADYDTEAFHESYPMTSADYDENHTHVFGDWITAVAPACTENGMEKRICSICENEETRNVAATGHTIVTDAAVTATCTEKGKTEGSHCSVCGTVLIAQEEIPAKGHTVVKDAAVAATCTEKGKTEGSHCSVCGTVLIAQEEIPAKGHTIVKDAAVTSTCTKTGLTEGSHCSVCEEVLNTQEVIPAVGHSYGEWTVTKEAPCTEKGSKTRSCTVCGSPETQAIPATGHTIVKDAAVSATCTEKGKTEGSHCSVCKAVLIVQEEIPAKGHTVVKDAAVTATCTKTGLTEGSHCSACGAVVTAQKVTSKAPNNHTWSTWKTVSKATVFLPEKQTRTCSACNASETRTVGTPLTKTISVTASSLTMKVKQKTTAFKVTFANGDSVKSWKSSNTKVVKVSGKANGTCTITAQKKAGNAKITITLASGLKKVIKVKVQSGAVKTTAVNLPSKKVTLKKGKKLTLKPAISPITSQDKVTYSSSNKKIATVTSKGVVKGVKAGTAKITVKSGTKKAVCTVVVTK